MVVPVAFTTDHIETLSEIDIELRETAEESGVRHFGRSPMFNGVCASFPALSLPPQAPYCCFADMSPQVPLPLWMPWRMCLRGT